jgi:hypothetical protein
MEVAEKMELAGFDVGRAKVGAWRVRRRLPAKKMRLTGSKGWGWYILNRAGEPIMDQL